MEIKMNEKELTDLINKAVKRKTEKLTHLVKLAAEIMPDAGAIVESQFGIIGEEITYFYKNEPIPKKEIERMIREKSAKIMKWNEDHLHKFGLDTEDILT
jgi:hypothetical protein